MDEFEFRNDIQKLKRGYLELDQLKYQKIVRSERIMKSAPGPQAPAQSWPMHTKIDLVKDLHEVAADARNNIAPHESLAYPGNHPEAGNLFSGPDLCDWLYLKANPLSEWPIADETVGETVRSQITFIARNIPHEEDIPQRQEPWQFASVIIQKLERVGVTITPDQLRQWGTRGHIQVGKRAGKNIYRLSHVLKYLKGEEDEK